MRQARPYNLILQTRKCRSPCPNVVGGVSITLILLSGIWIWGQWGEFSRSYVSANLNYFSDRVFTWPEAPFHLFYLLHVAPGFFYYLLPSMGFIGLCAIGMRPTINSWQRRIALFSLLLLLVSAFAAIAPGRNVFHHRLHFLFLPVALATGCFLWCSRVGARVPRLSAQRPSLGSARSRTALNWYLRRAAGRLAGTSWAYPYAGALF